MPFLGGVTFCEQLDLKTNLAVHPGRLTWNIMEPENTPNCKGKSSSKPSFSGSMLIFGGCNKNFFFAPKSFSSFSPGNENMKPHFFKSKPLQFFFFSVVFFFPSVFAKEGGLRK